MAAFSKPSPTALIVGLAMLLGGAARMYKLGDQSLMRDEIQTPGPSNPAIPSASTRPAELIRVIKSDLFYARQPPGYPILMFGFTRVLGASLFTARFPSVLFGVTSIGLVYWLGLLIRQRAAGCVASVLLAFNGFHVAQSRAANTYSLACFLALIATILLILLAQQTRRRKFVEFCYGTAMLFGLSCQHFFWALLATHMLWVVANAWIQERREPRLLNIQIFVMIFGSPLLTVSTLQSLNQPANVTPRFLAMVEEYLQFFWVIPGYGDATASVGAISHLPTLGLITLQGLFCLCSLGLFVVGSRRLGSIDDPTLSAPGTSSILLWILAAVFATIVDLGVAFAARRQIGQAQGPWIYTFRGVEVLAVLPSILFMAAITLAQSWQPLSAFGRGLGPRELSGVPRLILLLTILPFAMLAIASVFQRPFLNAPGLLFVAPYLLLTLACGIVAVGRRSRSLAIAISLVLITIHAYSVYAYCGR